MNSNELWEKITVAFVVKALRGILKEKYSEKIKFREPKSFLNESFDKLIEVLPPEERSDARKQYNAILESIKGFISEIRLLP
jgi:hypothetical protein